MTGRARGWNPRGGLALVRSQLFAFLSEKGFFWTLALGWMTGPLVYMLAWSCAAAQGEIGGFARNDFYAYYLFLIVVNQITYPTQNWSTAESINTGGISTALLRPMPLCWEAIACDAATFIACMPFVIAFCGVLFVALGLSLPVTGLFLLAALAALVFAKIVRFLLAYILAILAFFTSRTDALLNVNDTLVFLLAGQVAPIALFPDALRALALFLPYRYMLSFPVELLMGTLSGREIVFGFAMQLFWTGALAIVHRLVMRAGIRRYGATGG